MATADSTVKAVLNHLLQNGGGKYKVLESWKSEDGSSWYRKWSDGLIEQGVTFTTTPTSDWSGEVSLPVAFSSEAFDVLAQAFKLDKNSGDRAVTSDVYGKTTSSVFCGWYLNGAAYTTSIYIYARGY